MLKDLVIATHNPGKAREISVLLRPYVAQFHTAGELGLEEPEETGATFIANAILKAEAALRGSGRAALADDSGLVVEALDGAPGIYSARWGGPEKNFELAMRKVEDALAAKGLITSKAAFICALAIAHPDGQVDSFEGRVEGTLTFPARGLKGFGYDPIFIPDGETRTFAEMEPDEKQVMSHRAKAFDLLLEHVFNSIDRITKG